jgi:hypothetical protein
LLVALGVGAALVSGAGVAHADSSGTGSSPSRPSDSVHSVAHSRPAAVRTAKKPPRVTVAARLDTMQPTPPTPSEPAPGPVVVAALAMARRDPGRFAGPTPHRPGWATPSEATSTPYGDIGKWMLGRTGKLADWPSPAYPFKTLYQPINVIIVDSTSTTAEESAEKLNAALTAAGFPPQPIHSTGYRGVIDGVSYSQQPTGPEEAFSNANWLLVNDHGRVFGPSPGPAGTGFVWTASFSREQPGLYYLTPTHIYVSFDKARDAVRAGLVGSGATDLGLVDLDNTLVGRATTTGDHDGYAVVIGLN